MQAILSTGPEQQKLLDDLADTGSKLAGDVLNAWTMEEVYLYVAPDGSTIPVMLESQQDAAGRARAIRIDDGQFLKDASGKELRFGPSDLNTADADMRLRRAIQHALDTLALSDPDPDARPSAVIKLGNSQKGILRPVPRKPPGKGKNADVKKGIEEAIATLQLGDTDPAVQIAAVKQLAALNSIGSLDNLNQLAAKRITARNWQRQRAGHRVQSAAISGGSTFRHDFSRRQPRLGPAGRGAGLAITFGLMGIINMAHGEMIAVGAYTCYVVQNLFGSGFGFHIVLPFSFGGKPLGFGLHLPGLNATGWFYESYFLFAIPLSFLMAALAGLAARARRHPVSLPPPLGIAAGHLGRFAGHAANVSAWFSAPTTCRSIRPPGCSGHFTVNDVIFGYNRVFVIGFAVVIVIGTWLLLTKTPLGLLIRAVMQNRDMASCLGVRTERVNMLTFAFGSGLAGLAGAFLSQIGNVGPSLGQTYIVDSFMTVVVGGVGSIVGTVCSALGIGTADQVLQQTTGSPVTGKIVVLVAIILFLQWKPGGLFASRSRSLD